MSRDVFESDKLYTCKGRGGRYKAIKTVKASGVLRKQNVSHLVVYYDIDTNQHYARTEKDFLERMEFIV